MKVNLGDRILILNYIITNKKNVFLKYTESFSVRKKFKMCDLCKNHVVRSYSHSRTSHHKKMLFKLMQKKKIQSIEKFGYFKWEAD